MCSKGQSPAVLFASILQNNSLLSLRCNVFREDPNLEHFFFKATPALPYIYIYVGFQKQFERCVLQRHPFITIHTRHKKVPVHPLMPETAHLCLYLHLITRTRIKKKPFTSHNTQRQMLKILGSTQIWPLDFVFVHLKKPIYWLLACKKAMWGCAGVFMFNELCVISLQSLSLYFYEVVLKPRDTHIYNYFAKTFAWAFSTLTVASVCFPFILPMWTQL